MSALYTMECYENSPIDRLTLLKRLSLKAYLEMSKTDKRHTVKSKKAHYNKIQTYVKNHVENGDQNYKYQFSEAQLMNGMEGRVYNHKSLQQTDKNIGNYLFKGLGTDIDIKNCACCVIRLMCIHHKISLDTIPTLIDYIENRDKWLNEITNCKKTITMMLFDDAIKETFRNDDRLRKLKNEILVVQQSITHLEVYKDYLDKAMMEKDSNKLGSSFSAIYHMWENRIFFHLCELVGSRCIVPKFDGGIFEGVITDITEINQKMKEKYDGIVLVIKPLETILTDAFLLACKEEEASLKQLALSILENNRDYFQHHDNDLITYNVKTGLWEENQKKVKSIIYFMCPCEQTPEMIDRLYKMINYEVINDVKKDDWYEKKQNTSLGKILFKTGYFYKDENTLQFTNETTVGGNFNPAIMFRNKVHFPVPTVENQFNLEKMEDIRNRFFLNPLGKEIGNYFIELLARGLFGECMKKIVFCLGNTNTGKSTLVKAFQESFGDLIGSFNGETLTKTNTSQEEAQILRPFYLVRDKRLIFSNELKTSASLEGNAIKKISSGGDKLVARVMGGNEVPFNPHFLALIMANDISEISNYDDALETRVNVIHYTKPFVKEVNDPENELLADPNIDKEMKTDEFKWNFIGLILGSYSNFLRDGELPMPNEHIENRKKWIDKQANVTNLFLMTYKFTDNEADAIPCSEIIAWNKEVKSGVSDQRVGVELAEYAKKMGFKFPPAANKRLPLPNDPTKTKAVRCRFGLALICDE